MKTLLLLAASLAVFAQAPGAVRYLSYGGAPTAGDCTLALAGARVGVDTSTTPDTVYDCIDGGWVARPVKVVSGVPTVQSATDTSFVLKAGNAQLLNLLEAQDSEGNVQAFITTGTFGAQFGSDYAQFSASDGSSATFVDAAGRLAVHTSYLQALDAATQSIGAPFAINASTTTIQDPTATTGDTKLVVKAGAGQASNLQEWQDAAGTAVGIIDTFGTMQISGAEGTVTITTGDGVGFNVSNTVNVQTTNATGISNQSAISGGTYTPMTINASTTTIQDPTDTTGATLVDIVAGAAQTTKSVVLQTGGRITMPLTTPTTSGETCTAGTFTADTGFLYVCTAANTWKRAALSTF